MRIVRATHCTAINQNVWLCTALAGQPVRGYIRLLLRNNPRRRREGTEQAAL
jgi:hypothetical protein